MWVRVPEIHFLKQMDVVFIDGESTTIVVSSPNWAAPFHGHGCRKRSNRRWWRKTRVNGGADHPRLLQRSANVLRTARKRREIERNSLLFLLNLCECDFWVRNPLCNIFIVSFEVWFSTSSLFFVWLSIKVMLHGVLLIVYDKFLILCMIYVLFWYVCIHCNSFYFFGVYGYCFVDSLWQVSYSMYDYPLKWCCMVFCW